MTPLRIALLPLAAVATLAAATCQSRTPSAQPAQTQAPPPASDASAQQAGVAGAWAHREMPVRYLETMDLTVSGQTVSGTGTYMMEGGRAGKTTIAGTWRGGTLTLDLTRDSGVKERYVGTLEGGRLNGQLTIDGNAQPFTFDRPQP